MLKTEWINPKAAALLQRALEIKIYREGIGFKEASKETGLGVSTLHRLLHNKGPTSLRTLQRFEEWGAREC